MGSFVAFLLKAFQLAFSRQMAKFTAFKLAKRVGSKFIWGQIVNIYAKFKNIKLFFIQFSKINGVWLKVKHVLESLIKFATPTQYQMFERIKREIKIITSASNKMRALLDVIYDRVAFIRRTLQYYEGVALKEAELRIKIFNAQVREDIRKAKEEYKEFMKAVRKGDREAERTRKFYEREEAESKRKNETIAQRFIDSKWEDYSFKNILDMRQSLNMEQASRFNYIINQSGGQVFVSNTGKDAWFTAIFIPYYSLDNGFEHAYRNVADTPGVLKIRMKSGSIFKTRFKVYNWINVRYSVIYKLSKDASGKNLWKLFLRKNRKRLKHITEKSKYWKIVKKRKAKK